MKVKDIYESDAEYVRQNRAKKTPEELAEIDRWHKDAMDKHKAHLKSLTADHCPADEHDWYVTQDNGRGLIRYRCRKCPAAKAVDSTG